MVHPAKQQRLFRSGAACLLASCVAAYGCRTSEPDASRYVPPAGAAYEALDAVLSTWEGAQSANLLQLAEPPVTIHVADSWRMPGQRLVGFEILGEISGEGGRCFAVNLQLQNPAEERQVRYYVVGINPLWVFSEKDYLGAIHWDACVDSEAEQGTTGPPL